MYQWHYNKPLTSLNLLGQVDTTWHLNGFLIAGQGKDTWTERPWCKLGGGRERKGEERRQKRTVYENMRKRKKGKRKNVKKRKQKINGVTFYLWGWKFGLWQGLSRSCSSWVWAPTNSAWIHDASGVKGSKWQFRRNFESRTWDFIGFHGQFIQRRLWLVGCWLSLARFWSCPRWRSGCDVISGSQSNPWKLMQSARKELSKKL